MIENLNRKQKMALKILLTSKKNVFLTGAAGTGKSHVVKLFREVRKLQQNPVPMVASTGAAAILVNGTTFNSYFGLGIMAGGTETTIAQALTSRAVVERLIYADLVVVDEVSMISGETMEAANLLCQKIRQNNKFFGGIRMIFVGDFFQLGPYTEGEKLDWIFLHRSWKKAGIQKIELDQVMRTDEKTFLKILGKVRKGKIDKEVNKFLSARVIKNSLKDYNGPRILSRNKEVDKYNQEQLLKIKNPEYGFKTEFVGEERFVKRLKENLMIGEVIKIKKGALVMLRVNNFQEGYINGTIGVVEGIREDILSIRKLSGELIHVKKHIFEYIDGSGEILARARNFPLTLAWAITIHKSQGATLDTALISLDKLWLHGQAYTALSRLKTAQGLMIDKFDKNSFKVDKNVLKYK